MHPEKIRETVFRQTKRRTKLGFTVLAPAFALLVEAPANAEPSHYRVELSAKQLPACDRLEDFEGLLDLVLAQPLLEPPASRVLSTRIVRTSTGGYGVDLVFKDLDNQVLDTIHREYPAAMCCHEVLYKAALAAALWMEKRETPPAEPPAPAKGPEPYPAPKSPPPAAPPPSTPTESPLPPLPVERRWFLGAGGLFAVGSPPRSCQADRRAPRRRYRRARRRT